MFCVYILQNPKDLFYIGHTDDLVTCALCLHDALPICRKFTRKNGPWILVWSEEHPDRSSATRREREIKNWKSARLIRERLLYSEECSSLVESRRSRD